MNLSQRRARNTDLRLRLSALDNKVANVKKNRDQYLLAKEKFDAAEKLREQAVKYLYSLERLLERYVKEHNDYRKDRIGFLEISINEKLMKMFPYDQYQIKIDFKPNENVTFKFLDRTGTARSMSISAGGMMQSMIPFSVFFTIVETLGYGILWMDEGFAASDDENLDKITEELRDFIEQGYQIWMVEHRDTAYVKLPRREVHLLKDFDTGSVGTIEHKVF